jgi:A/G-specific adenine glycosylase
MIDSRVRTRIRRRLLNWYDRSARDLPWRNTDDPYAIWVSEIMLQQTQVDTVCDYYRRFLKRFPTVRDLAKARLDSVLKVWEGLGYYSRARHLHQAARIVADQHQGQVPTTHKELMALPGIGRYTAGAIASIAFGRQEPVLDGNVIRVLCRLVRFKQSPKSRDAQVVLWDMATHLVPRKRPGDFNQAMMELGATVCHRDNSLCSDCPLAVLCLAYEHQEQAALPMRIKAKTRPRYTVAVGIIYKRGRILIDKRKPEGLLGGLWEFPGGKQEPGETLEAALRREVKEELDVTVRVERLLTTVHHVYSHFEVDIHAFVCTYVKGTPKCLACTDVKWVYPKHLTRYAFPGANRKIFKALGI